MTTPNAAWQWYAVGSALFAALTAILAKVGVSGVNSNFATLIRTIVILLVTAAIVWWRKEWEPGALTTRGTRFLVLSGLATGLSWLCYFRALQLAPASKVAPIDKLSVALVVVMAALFLGEPMTGRVLLGASLVVAGVVVLAGGN